MKSRTRTVLGAAVLLGLIGALLQRSGGVADAQRSRRRQPPPPPTIPGDFDGNWQVNVADLSMFRARFGSDDQGGQLCEPYNVMFDLWPWDAQNNLPMPDGRVDIDDFWTLWYSNPAQVHTEWQSGDVTGLAAKDGCAVGYPDAPPDDFVDFHDLIPFAEHWHTTPQSPNWDPIFDFCNQNGRKAPGTHAPVPMDNEVNFFDLICFAEDWHQGDGPAPQQSQQALLRTRPGVLALDLNAGTPGVQSSLSARQGDEIEVAVIARGVNGLAGYDFKVAYDLDALELVGFPQEQGNFLESRRGKALLLDDLRTPGVVWLTGALVGPDWARAPSGTGAIACIRFRTAGDQVGPTAIELNEGLIYETPGGLSACSPNSARIAVAPKARLIADSTPHP
ncbi:MAG: cohesin domain-containing protein [Armatimonadota bacterium]